MLKNKKFLFAALLLATCLEARSILNAVSVLVNNEPITLYEIHKLSSINKVSKKEALQMLIEKRLEESQIKKLGINASDFEIDTQISKIAEKNSMSKEEFVKFISSKGMSERDYKEQIASGIKAQKLYAQIFNAKNAVPSEADLKAYYEANKDKFQRANNFIVTSYSSLDESSLNEIIASPMSVIDGVKVSREVLRSDDLGEKILYFLNETPKGKFTPIVKTANGFVTFLVADKTNYSEADYEKVIPMLKNMLYNQKQQASVKNYFDKLKASANIEVLRRP